MPWFAVNELKPYISSFKNVTAKKRLKAIQKGADRLLTMQTSSGGLAYWPGGDSPTEWASAYGGYALILAKENGATVPQQSIDGLCAYLQEVLPDMINRRDQWNDEAATRVLYILALNGKAKQSDINNLFEKSDRMNDSARAFLAMAMHQFDPEDKDCLKLLEKAKVKHDDGHWMRYSTNDQIRLEALCKINPKSDKVHQLMDLITRSANSRGHWGNTWANSATINAMAAYAKVVKGQGAQTSITLNINGQSQTIELDTNTPMKTVRVPLGDDVSVSATATGLAYSNTTVFCKPKLENPDPISEKGVAISKTYFRIRKDGSREPLTNPTVGDLVEVELEVHFKEALNYVVIDDPLPTTFECVNSEFKSQATHVTGTADRNWSVSNQELRNDRALFFLDRSWYKSSQKLSYLARITASGNVAVPPAKVEAMYDPSVYGLTGSTRLQCAPRK